MTSAKIQPTAPVGVLSSLDQALVAAWKGLIHAVSVVGVLLSAAALTAISAQSALGADDPLAPIKKAVESEYDSCGGPGPHFGTLRNYSSVLEAIAQSYSRTGKLDPVPPGFTRIQATRGRGDPQSEAINAAFNGGARKSIHAACSFDTIGYVSGYGVGFVRINSVDYVTIVLGFPAPPPSSPPCDPKREKCTILK